MNTSYSATTATRAFQLQCPKCRHGEALLLVSSRSVVTVRCASCHHPWALETSALPKDMEPQSLPQTEDLVPSR